MTPDLRQHPTGYPPIPPIICFFGNGNQFDPILMDSCHKIAVFCWIVFAIKVMTQSDVDEKIVQGEPADITKYPYAGSMRKKTIDNIGTHKCMTVLVTSTYAITAAHCVVMDSECLPMETMNFTENPHFILMGTADSISWGPNVQRSDIVRGMVHPQYTYTAPFPYPSRYDIGALTVKTPFVLNNFVAVAPLFPGGTAYWNTISRMQGDPTEGNCRMVGWGATVNLHPKITPAPVLPPHIKSSPRLLRARFLLINRATCCRLYPAQRLCLEQIASTGFDCCISIMKTTSTGLGDSGAPLVCKWHVTGNDILVGINQGGHLIRLVPEGDIVIRPNLYVRTEVMMDYITRVTGMHFVPIHTGLGAASTVSLSFLSFFLFLCHIRQ